MFKNKRPSFKYKIQKITKSNVHTNNIVHEVFIVYVKDNSSIFNCWYFIDGDGDMNAYIFEDANYLGRCVSLEEAKRRLDEFITKQTKQFEMITKQSKSIVDYGNITV